VVVLDLNLPDGDGLALCRDLRARGYADAIIMVTARDSALDRVLGLELGADDYLTKPFEPRELLARVRNLMKRIAAPEPARPRSARFARFGPWKLDLLLRRLVTRDGRLVILSSAEYRLLSRMIEAPNQVLRAKCSRPSARRPCPSTARSTSRSAACARSWPRSRAGRNSSSPCARKAMCWPPPSIMSDRPSQRAMMRRLRDFGRR
jgi:chemotaxis response regulator CheB